jgi:hypothetical protein
VWKIIGAQFYMGDIAQTIGHFHDITKLPRSRPRIRTGIEFTRNLIWGRPFS